MKPACRAAQHKRGRTTGHDAIKEVTRGRHTGIEHREDDIPSQQGRCRQSRDNCTYPVTLAQENRQYEQHISSRALSAGA